MSPLGRALVGFAVAAVGTWVAGRLARRIGLVDRPGPRKPHPSPVPVAGGVAIAAALTAGVAGKAGPLPLLTAVWALVVVGVIDDARDLRARTRLAAQAAASLPVAVVYTPQLGVPRPLEVFVGLLFLLGVISAIKCIDSADAVGGTVAATAALSLGWLSGWDGPAGMTSAALAGAAAGFLVFNVPPARCFLGEGGSTLLGLVLAFVALGAADAVPRDRTLSVAAAASTVLAVPVLDFILVHARRVRRGIRGLADLMGSTGLDHLPHRLAKAGLGPRTMAATCAGAVALSGVAAQLCLRGGLVASLAGGAGVVLAFLGAEIALQRALVEGGGGSPSYLRRRRAVASGPRPFRYRDEEVRRGPAPRDGQVKGTTISVEGDQAATRTPSSTQSGRLKMKNAKWIASWHDSIS